MASSATGPRSLSSPEDQSVTFVELFFDLVFVFSVTQVVGLFHHGLDWSTAGQGILVFWLVWWAWSQFTWALNAADTTHQWVQLGTLLATAVAFFMAIAVPDVYKTCTDLEAAGVAIPRPPGPMKFGGTSRAMAFIEDPDGYKIELIERQ